MKCLQIWLLIHIWISSICFSFLYAQVNDHHSSPCTVKDHKSSEQISCTVTFVYYSACHVTNNTTKIVVKWHRYHDLEVRERINSNFIMAVTCIDKIVWYCQIIFLAWGTLSTQGIVILSGVVVVVVVRCSSFVGVTKSCPHPQFKHGRRYWPTFFF